jgi:hypothetical protein
MRVYVILGFSNGGLKDIKDKNDGSDKTTQIGMPSSGDGGQVKIKIESKRVGASRAHGGIIAQGTEFMRVIAATILIQ